MAVNLKNITDLPVVESAEGLNLIVNDNGAAKQIAASAVGMQADWAETDESSAAFVRNKPRRELMYEWNFEADENLDNCVWEMYENVDDDISWLTTMSEDCDWEIEVSQYGRYEYYDDSMSESIDVVVPDIWTTGTMNEKSVTNGCFQNNNVLTSCFFMGWPQDYLNNWDKVYYDNNCAFSIYNKVHYNDNFYPTQVSNGGHIAAYSDNGGPLKSIKIYKVTK